MQETRCIFNTFRLYNFDWVGDLNNPKSTSSYIFLVNGTTISWSNKKKKTVAFNSSKVEYIAYTQVVKETLWLRKFLQCCE